MGTSKEMTTTRNRTDADKADLLVRLCDSDTSMRARPVYRDGALVFADNSASRFVIFEYPEAGL